MRIGLSTCGKDITEDLFRAYRDSGIDCMEISTAYDQYHAGDQQDADHGEEDAQQELAVL